MVRFKTRWLLVKIDTIDPLKPNKSRCKHRLATSSTQDATQRNFPPKKEFVSHLRKSLSWCFGLAGEPMLVHTLVKFYDPCTQLALIRCPRQYCGQVRAALTFASRPHKQQQQLPLMTCTGDDPKSHYNIVCSVVSVHGSARTSKISTIRICRNIYRQKLLAVLDPCNEEHSTTRDALCKELQDRLDTLVAMN